MRNCFVPLCDAKCRDWTKRMMFMAPKDDTVFQQWMSRLPQQRRQFRKSDRICERHFLKDDIITTWDHVINGKVHKLERTKPKLKREAVPSLNLEYTPPLFERYPRKSKDNQKSPNAKKQKLNENGELIILVPPPPPPSTGQSEVDGTIIEEQVKKEMNTGKIASAEENVVPISTSITTTIDANKISDDTLQKFDSLYDDVFEVTLPNTLWGWHRDCSRKFIVISKFSLQFAAADKMIIIHSNLNMNTFVLDKKISESFLDDTDPDNLSAIIENIDQLKLCAGISDAGTRANCMYIVEEEEQEQCEKCRNNNIKDRSG